MSAIYNSFQFRDAISLRSIPLIGTYNYYLGGGYVYELRGKLGYIIGNLTLLEQMQWIDRHTRAIIVEFNVYNPSMNIFMVATLTFEVLPSGNFISTMRLDPLNLFNGIKGGLSWSVLLCDFIYLAFIVYFMVKEILKMIKIGPKSYFLDFWNYIEWGIIVLTWCSVAIFLYRLTVAEKVLDFFKKTAGYGYYSLQLVNSFNQTLSVLLGICSGLGTIRFLKILRFNKNISILATTLNHSIGKLIGFGIDFMIKLLAFVQLFYLLFYQDIMINSTLIKTMEFCFEMMLGNSSAKAILKANPILGPIIFGLFNLLVVLVSLNILISIIVESFDTIRKNSELQNKDTEVIEYGIEKIVQSFKKNQRLIKT